MKSNKLYISPYIRLFFLTCCIIGTVLINNVLWLIGCYVIVILPLFIYGCLIEKHIKLMLFGMLPIYLSFILLYIVILNGINGSWQFINLKLLKLILFTSIIQLTLLVPDQYLISTFKSWGLKGEALITVLGAFTVWADVNYRADKIVTARFSRGFIKKRNFLQKIKQFPYILIPLVVGIMRTATERAQSWEQKDIIHLVEIKKSEQVRFPLILNICVFIASSLFLLLSLFGKFYSK